MPQDLQLLGQRFPRVGERVGLVGTLVVRLAPRQGARARDPGGPSHVPTHVQHVWARAVAVGLRLGQREGALVQPRRRPRGFIAPCAAHLAPVGRRQRGPLGEQQDGRLAVHAVVDALQPPVPPPELLGQDVVVRARQRGLGGRVGPRADQQPLRARQRLERAKRVVAIAVRPPRDDHGGALDGVVGGTQRSELPVVVEALMREPRQHPRLVRLHAALPFLAPALPEDRGHGRQRVHGDHVGGVVHEVDGLHRAAEVVDVVRVAVVGGEDGDDGLQRGRPFHPELDRVEAAVGGAVHPHVPARPLPRGEPVDHGEHVGSLDGRILVLARRPRRSRCRAHRRGTPRSRTRPDARTPAGTTP